MAQDEEKKKTIRRVLMIDPGGGKTPTPQPQHLCRGDWSPNRLTHKEENHEEKGISRETTPGERGGKNRPGGKSVFWPEARQEEENPSKEPLH